MTNWKRKHLKVRHKHDIFFRSSSKTLMHMSVLSSCDWKRIIPIYPLLSSSKADSVHLNGFLYSIDFNVMGISVDWMHRQQCSSKCKLSMKVTYGKNYKEDKIIQTHLQNTHFFFNYHKKFYFYCSAIGPYYLYALSRLVFKCLWHCTVQKKTLVVTHWLYMIHFWSGYVAKYSCLGRIVH